MAVFAEALIANTDTGIRPSEIHDHLRRGSKTPLIRSTAPPPETFGTEQQVAVGRPIVPPRDYSRTVEIPPLNEYDSDEVGRIYDITYQGIEGGELVLRYAAMPATILHTPVADRICAFHMERMKFN